jgi:hypothetical protein
MNYNILVTARRANGMVISGLVHAPDVKMDDLEETKAEYTELWALFNAGQISFINLWEVPNSENSSVVQQQIVLRKGFYMAEDCILGLAIVDIDMLVGNQMIPDGETAS